MKNLILFFFVLITIGAHADDTAALQALITASNTTLPANHAAYHVTSLTLSHNLNCSGDTIYVTATSGNGFVMSTSNVKLSNGTIIGPTDVYGSGTTTGVNSSAVNDTVTNCTIKTFPSYGIYASANSLVVTDNTVADTGYIGFWFSSTGNSIGGKCTGNIFDRSMLSASTITQPAVAIRCAVSYFTRRWTINNNTFKMPLNPTDGSAACIEVRYANNSTLSSNICQGGNIGISVVGSDSTKTTLCTFTAQKSEALEYTGNYGNMSYNTITNQLNDGILIDGSPAGHTDTISYNNISGFLGSAIHLYAGVTSIFIVGCNITFTSGVHNADAMHFQGATQIAITLCNFNGNNTGRNVVLLDNTTGGLYMSSSTVNNFASNVIKVYANTPIVINNILMQNVTVNGTPLGLGSTLNGGASLGSNIQVN